MSSRTATVLVGVLTSFGLFWTAGCGSHNSAPDTPNAEQERSNEDSTGALQQVTLEITGMS